MCSLHTDLYLFNQIVIIEWSWVDIIMFNAQAWGLIAVCGWGLKKKEGLTHTEMDQNNILTVLCVFVIFFLLFLILGYCYVNYLLSNEATIYLIYFRKHGGT